MVTKLILGDGLLGSELKRQTDWDYVSHADDGFDLLQPYDYDQFLNGYDCLVNCTGFTKDHSDRKRNVAMNYNAVIDLVNYCNMTGKKYIHISTDIVYSGSVSFAKESDVPVHARNWYSYSKLLADGYVQSVAHDYLIIRTAFKPRPFPYRKAFRKIGNFDYVDTIAELIIRLIEMDASGVYNVGTSVKTMYQHACETVPNIKLDNNSILVDVTMNIDKMQGVLDGE